MPVPRSGASARCTATSGVRFPPGSGPGAAFGAGDQAAGAGRLGILQAGSTNFVIYSTQKMQTQK